MNRNLLSAVFLLLLFSCVSPELKIENVALIPQPKKFNLNEGAFIIGKNTQISVQDESQDKAAVYFSEMFLKPAGFSLEIVSGGPTRQIAFENIQGLAPEAYQLKVTPRKITIQAGSEAGYFYAVQTLRQLLPAEIESDKITNTTWPVPCVEIEDSPRFQWRGMHMDFSRHFFSVEEVEDFLDLMALYKLNTFHMHLTDDQGWRIEIKKYPLLTQNGAWRTENKQDSLCNELAQTDSLYTIDKTHFRTVNGQKMYGGFFTQEQIGEIVQYAASRCITVVPEIDMPGHMKAAIDNYPYLSCTGESGWGNNFSVPTCLGQEETYEFMENVLAEVAGLFPGKYIHIGGDEVNIQSWTACQKCQDEIKKNHLKDEHELQSYFNRRIEKFLQSKGKELIGWDEIAQGGLSKDATIMWWRNWAPKLRNVAAENGNQIVMTPDFEYYFDFAQESTPLNKVYNYEPVPADFSSEEAKLVIGVQANLWSERIANYKRLQFMAFPRALALAETGWAQRENKSFENFSERLQQHYNRFDQLKAYYYIPPVANIPEEVSFVDSIFIEPESLLPGCEIYYTMDGSVPQKTATKYEKPLLVKNNLEIKFRAYRGEVASPVSTVTTRKVSYVEPANVQPETTGWLCMVNEKTNKPVEYTEVPDSFKWEPIDKLSLGRYSAQSNYSMVFKSYFYAEKSGIYVFSSEADDGSLVYIGGQLVVNNGGNHSLRKNSGSVALQKGWHPVVVKYHQGGGDAILAVSGAEYGRPLQELDAFVLRY